MAGKIDIRPSAVSGTFYPGDPGELATELDALFETVQAKSPHEKIAGIIAPHAGYLYSGITAAAAYACIKGAVYETVVVVSPSHREYFEGASVYAGDAYQTPLGEVPVDKELRTRLLALCPIVQASTHGHGEEHAIEVQLPFLQHVLKSFSLVPIVMGRQSRGVCMQLGKALATVVEGKSILLVASSDLSHYRPASEADRLDGRVIELINQYDPARLMDSIESGQVEACGGGPMVTVLVALRELGVAHVEVVHHSNSGDTTGDRRSVVGYLSAIAYN